MGKKNTRRRRALRQRTRRRKERRLEENQAAEAVARLTGGAYTTNGIWVAEPRTVPIDIKMSLSRASLQADVGALARLAEAALSQMAQAIGRDLALKIAPEGPFVGTCTKSKPAMADTSTSSPSTEPDDS